MGEVPDADAADPTTRSLEAEKVEHAQVQEEKVAEVPVGAPPVAEGETVDESTKVPVDASAAEAAPVKESVEVPDADPKIAEEAVLAAEPKEIDGNVSDKGCGTWFC